MTTSETLLKKKDLHKFQSSSVAVFLQLWKVQILPTLLCDIPAEQRKPVCFSTAALISSTIRAPTVSCSSAQLCSPSGGTGINPNQCWRPADLTSSATQHHSHWWSLMNFQTNCKPRPERSSCLVSFATGYLYWERCSLWSLGFLEIFVGSPGCTLCSASANQSGSRSCFSDAAARQQSGPCRPRRCWLSRWRQSETLPQSPPHWPPCNWRKWLVYMTTLTDVWKKKKQTDYQHLLCQVRLPVWLAHSRHLKIRTQFLCILHPHVSSDAVSPGLVAHSYDANREMAIRWQCNVCVDKLKNIRHVLLSNPLL